jgi:hypothetical protein
MRQVSCPVTIDDVCLFAAIHGPVRHILQDLRLEPKQGFKNHVLAAAAYFGHESLVEKLIPEWKGPDYWPSIVGDPVKIAASQGHTRIMFMLLNVDEKFKKSRSSEYMDDKWGYLKMNRRRGWKYYHKVTHAAAAAGHTDLIRQFLGPWTSFKFPGSCYGYAIPDGWSDLLTLIILAAANGHTDCVAFLMQDRHREAASTRRHLHKAAILQKAAENGHEELVRWCISNSTPEELEVRYTAHPKSAYVAAASGDYTDIMRILPIDGKWNVYHLEGAISRAAHFGHIKVAQHVLDEGFDLNANSLVWPPKPRPPHKSKAREAGKWVTPLLAAIANEQVKVVEFLLQNSLDLDINTQLLQTALTMAEEVGNGRTVVILQLYSTRPKRRRCL